MYIGFVWFEITMRNWFVGQTILKHPKILFLRQWKTHSKSKCAISECFHGHRDADQNHSEVHIQFIALQILNTNKNYHKNKRF